MRYVSMGQVPAKRHTQFRAEPEGTLLVEEVMGYEGFSGNESILYHLQSPAASARWGSSRRGCWRSGCPTRTRTA